MLPVGPRGWAWGCLVQALKGRNDRGRGQISTVRKRVSFLISLDFLA